MASDLILGNPVKGKDFLFRTAFLDDLWEGLRKNHILLTGPRRMGKTSVMYHLLEHPRDDHRVVYLNTEALAKPSDFILQLIFGLREYQPSYFFEELGMIWGLYKNLIRHSRSPEFFQIKQMLQEELNWEEHWQDQANQLLQGIRKINHPVVFMIDELPDMLLRMKEQGSQEIENFLHWFRMARQTPDSPVRWVVAGSANLIGTLDKLGYTRLINDFYLLDLPPFSLNEMEQFVVQTFAERGMQIENGVVERIQKNLGKSLPFFLQLMVRELIVRARSQESQTIKKGMVDDVFEKVLLGDLALGHLQHFYSRIDMYYPEGEREAVRDLLGWIAVSNGVTLKDMFSRYAKADAESSQTRSPVETKQAFSRLLLLLQTDYYLEETGKQRYDFSSQLVKSWWRKYYPGE